MRSAFRFPPPIARRSPRALTLLELMTVLVVISILIVALAPTIPYMKARSQKVVCVGNLRSLHVAAGSYLQDNQHWPQISGNGYQDKEVANLWIAAMTPYGLVQKNWICPFIQGELHAPDLSDPDNVRIDYLAMPFGPDPRAPFLYQRQPWFIEAADVHGNGHEVIFPDGHIEESYDIIRAATGAGTAGSPSN